MMKQVVGCAPFQQHEDVMHLSDPVRDHYGHLVLHEHLHVFLLLNIYVNHVLNFIG